MQCDSVVSEVIEQTEQAVLLRFQSIVLFFMNHYGLAPIREGTVFMGVSTWGKSILFRREDRGILINGRRLISVWASFNCDWQIKGHFQSLVVSDWVICLRILGVHHLTCNCLLNFNFLKHQHPTFDL